MANQIAARLDEAITDPDPNAWYDSQGLENAAKCGWTFGTTCTTANGGIANMNLGGRDWLIQQKLGERPPPLAKKECPDPAP